MNQRNTTYIILAVAAVLLLLCCCGAIAVGFYLYSNGTLDQFLTPQGSPTKVPAQLPTRAAAAAPTRTPPAPPPVPTATFVPEAQQEVKMLWDFVQADGWATDRTEGDYNVVIKSLVDGKYDWRLTAKQPGNHQTYRDDLDQSIFPEDYYQLDVDIQRLEGVESGAYGFVFNYVDGDNFVTFLMNDMGNCLISARVNGQWQTLGGGVQHTNAVRSGEVNHMTVKVSPAAMYAYINGELAIAEESYAIETLAGTIGLSAELYNAGDTIHLQFDNYKLSHPAAFGR